MLGTIRKFSSSVYAKVFLFIVAIPFVFWGMGPVFQGGKQNTVAEIGKEKISVEEFVNYLKYYSSNTEVLNEKNINKLLSNFVGEKLINLEIKNLDIILSDESLRKIIRNEKLFQKENEFSRLEYEKFLVKNQLTTLTLEANISNKEKKSQLFDFIGKGIIPPSFIVDSTFNKINQKRNVEIINLNDIFKKKSNFSKNQIEKYFKENKESFNEIYRTIKFVKLDPENLTDNKEFNNLFFEKIDEIDDFLFEGKNLDFISKEFNLQLTNTISVNELGKNKKSENIKILPDELVKTIFKINESEPTILTEQKNQFYIIELVKTEKVQKEIEDDSVQKQILSNLQNNIKRKSISEIIAKINSKSFRKDDFYAFSKNENATIKKIKLDNANDDKSLKKEILNQIYQSPENKVILVSDVSFSEIYLIYISNIKNVKIKKNSDDYEKYLKLSKARIENNLYNTYDTYLRNKYKININYKALDNIKNYIE